MYKEVKIPKKSIRQLRNEIDVELAKLIKLMDSKTYRPIDDKILTFENYGK